MHKDAGGVCGCVGVWVCFGRRSRARWNEIIILQCVQSLWRRSGWPPRCPVTPTTWQICAV